MKRPCPLLAALLLPICASAAVPFDWVADVDRPAPVPVPVLRGETVDLRAALVRRGRPFDPAADSATIYWQTNGMGDAWWSAPASVSSNVLSATFTPAMDPGATLVSAFIGTTGEDGRSYRAWATLRILHAPGAVPNELPLPARAIDFATVAVTNAPWALPADIRAAYEDATNYTDAAVADIDCSCVGGYATPAPFWYPAAEYDPTSASNGRMVAEGDIVSEYASSASIPDKRLFVATDARPLEGAQDAPAVTWTQTGGSAVASLDGNRLLATGAAGLAYVRATDTGGVSRALSVPFAAPQTGSLLQFCVADATNTWRAAVNRFVHDKFAAVDTNAFHVYKYHRDTVFDEPGHSTWTAPDALQLYAGTRADWNDHDPRGVNAGFFDATLGDALRCLSSPRGDWYAHRPYIAVAPHYILGVNHWTAKAADTWTVFCTNRNPAAFLRVTFPRVDRNRVLVVRDVSLHRTDTAIPQEICARFLRNGELAKLSPSWFYGGTFVTVTTHNTVHPFPLTSRAIGGAAAERAAPWDAFSTRWPPRFTYDPDGRLLSLFHDVHDWESGHPCFLWAPNGRLALASTWTFASGGWNAFFNEELIDAIRYAVEKDSGGAETILEWTKEDLQ